MPPKSKDKGKAPQSAKLQTLAYAISSNPVVTAVKCFPLGWYFKPWDTTKTHAYYMTIFEIKSSVNFKHFNLKQYHTEPTYSTSIIKDVIHPERALNRKKVVVR